MGAPRWDSDAVSSSLIGGRSSCAITPLGRYVWGGYYEEGSLIWRSRWVIEDGIVECREALAFPGAPHRAIVLRRVTARDARAQLTVFLAPRRASTLTRWRARRRRPPECGPDAPVT
ncbi:hypothetical protein ABZ746_25605 [Streptomyces sp. NPDC020096]